MGSMEERPGKELSLTVLGARGSIPVQGAGYTEFGGATTCYVLQTDRQALFIDAGTGITLADKAQFAGRQAAILLTHPHLDHLMGLPFFPLLAERERTIDLYGAERGGACVSEQIDALYRPPFWPCGLDAYPANIEYHTISYQPISYRAPEEPLSQNGGTQGARFTVGDFAVAAMEVPHPGGCTAYRISVGGVVIVIATDAELPMPYGAVFGRPESSVAAAGGRTAAYAAEFLAFLSGADLFLCDSQYTAQEATARAGYGHSTPEIAMAWQQAAEIGQLMLVHHDPVHDDVFIRNYEQQIGRSDVRFARSAEVVTWNLKD